MTSGRPSRDLALGANGGQQCPRAGSCESLRSYRRPHDGGGMRLAAFTEGAKPLGGAPLKDAFDLCSAQMGCFGSTKGKAAPTSVLNAINRPEGTRASAAIEIARP